MHEESLRIGSVSSGIEAATLAWNGKVGTFAWYADNGHFPTKFLAHTYPNKLNLGDLTKIPEKTKRNEIEYVDILCGGTPCQSFSYAGLNQGLADERGNLTLSFVSIFEEMKKQYKNRNIKNDTKQAPAPILFWENVEGVLTDKTNAFGVFISALVGLSMPLSRKKWNKSGVLHGPSGRVAWRTLDAKYFGLPQQRKRVYLIASGLDFYPENVLFEVTKSKENQLPTYPNFPLYMTHNNVTYEVFRGYSDCLYAAYGTKWNGNAAARNGSLFVAENKKIRRLTPLECERLMGLPDNYTLIPSASITQRYQAIGNSWAVPVIRWLGERIKQEIEENKNQQKVLSKFITNKNKIETKEKYIHLLFDKNYIELDKVILNTSVAPNQPVFTSLLSIIDTVTTKPANLYLSKRAIQGIIHRAEKNKAIINPNLLTHFCSQLSDEY